MRLGGYEVMRLGGQRFSTPTAGRGRGRRGHIHVYRNITLSYILIKCNYAYLYYTTKRVESKPAKNKVKEKKYSFCAFRTFE